MNGESVVVFRNAALLDPERGEFVPDRSILVEGGRVVEVGGSEVAGRGGRLIDVRGRTLMPGLIDGHLHVTAVTADLAGLAEWSPYYVAARTAEVLGGMLARGFTTVRDLGGADYGLAAAVDEGYLAGPRIIFRGKALTQTGGHGDMRPRGRTAICARAGARRWTPATPAPPSARSVTGCRTYVGSRGRRSAVAPTTSSSCSAACWQIQTSISAWS